LVGKGILERIERQEQAKEFFGSWFSIRGKKQTGYFLGHEFIRALEKAICLKEVALLKAEEVKKLGMKFLKALAN
jgi:hypothetical protein